MTGGWVNGHWQSDYELETAISSRDLEFFLFYLTLASQMHQPSHFFTDDNFVILKLKILRFDIETY